MKSKPTSIAALLSVCAAFGFSLLTSSLEAAQISGAISFAGDYRPVDSGGNVVSDITLADMIKFGPDGDIGPTFVVQTSGDFITVPLFVNAAIASPLDVNPAGVLPAGAMWSVSGFSLTLSSISQDMVTSRSLRLSGVGTITGPGYDPTPGNWIATFNTIGGTFSWSSSSGSQPCDCVLAIVCPPDTRVQCGSDTSPAATGTATVTATGTCAPDLSYSDVTTTSTLCPQNKTITRTWTATPQCGEPQTCVQTIIVEDTIAPMISGVGGPFTIQCDQPVVFSEPTASDNCDPAPSLTFTDATVPGNCPQNYTIVRTRVATDACGNRGTASQSITVVDTTMPVISGVGGAFTIQCDQPLVFSSPTASDNCDPAPRLIFADETTPGNCPQNKTVKRTWIATDACGNSSTASQTITVVDTTAPVISGVGGSGDDSVRSSSCFQQSIGER